MSWPDDPEPVTRAQPVVHREPVVHAEPFVPADDTVTEPMRARADHLLHAPAETWHSDPVESWHSLLADRPATPAAEQSAEPPQPWRSILDDLLSDLPPIKPKAEPIGFAHNGFHVDEEQRFQPLPPPAPKRAGPSRHDRSARHDRSDEPQKRPFWFESNSRHSRDDDPDDASRYGRHSMPGPN